jgi:hypothetical protein
VAWGGELECKLVVALVMVTVI